MTLVITEKFLSLHTAPETYVFEQLVSNWNQRFAQSEASTINLL